MLKVNGSSNADKQLEPQSLDKGFLICIFFNLSILQLKDLLGDIIKYKFFQAL